MKKTFIAFLSALLFSPIQLLSQNNLELINSATFTVPNAKKSNLGVYLACVNTVSPPSNVGTQVDVNIPINKWSYVALTKSSTNECNLYVNGFLIFTGKYADIQFSWTKLILGCQLSGKNYFNGLIDEVRISNSVRTASDVDNYFNSNSPFTSDQNTIGLWHFDQNSGTSISSTTGPTGTAYNAGWSLGKFGNAISYNGTNSYSEFQITTPISNSTIELWINPNTIAASWPLFTSGNNSAGFLLQPYESAVNYTWSTGSTETAITVNPSTLPYIWVTDGVTTDTVYFVAPKAVIHDTVKITNTVVPDGLIAYYPFSGNANDESGNGNNGTVNGATLTKDRFGKENNAYSFDGVSNYIKVLNNSLLDVQSNHSFSVSFWIKHDLSKTNFATYIISKYYAYDYSVTSFGIGTDETGNAYSMTLPVSGSYTNDIELRGNRTINDGKWHNFIYTWENGKSASIYIDNIKDTSKLSTIAGSIINSNDLFFGCGVKMTQFYCGNIDDIKIYNRVLDSTEVQSLFTEGTCKETVYDTVQITKTVHLNVTDTLFINALLTGVAASNNSNIIKVFPNPANDHISIDFGDFTRMSGYTVKIVNEIGKTVYESIVNQQSTTIDLNSWTGTGVYVINVIDTNNAVIESRKIVLE